MAMRWFARPNSNARQLRSAKNEMVVAPRLASWDRADSPAQVRLRAYLDDAEALLVDSRIDGRWALRLDVGLPPERDLLDASDLDNYAYPLACRLRDPGLVSVWCTKQHSERSFVRIEAAREVSAPSTEVIVAKTTASASTVAFKEQIHAAVAGAVELPAGPVRLELAFVVGPQRNWLNLWKQTIDSLDPILGRTLPDRAWHPRDGRITELGMHVTVDPASRNEIMVGIAATPTDVPLKSASERPTCASEVNPNDYAAGVIEFRDDDAGYLAWLAAHPDGYVINILRSHSTNTARAHHAGCPTISGQNPAGGGWTGPYVKVCADQLAELDHWACDQVGKPIQPCGTCHPR
jgi:hypothetical protein